MKNLLRGKAGTSALVLTAAILLASCQSSPTPSPQGDTRRLPAPDRASPPKNDTVRRREERALPGRRSSKPVDEDVLTRDAARLKKGHLAYSTPKKMRGRETGHVTARIGDASVSLGTLEKGMRNDPDASGAVADTPISSAMKMTLTSSDFEITPLSSEEQTIGGPPTAWEWDIVAKHSGELHLHLAATVVLNNLSRDFTTIDRDVAVQVDWVDDAETFVTGNWQWFIGTLSAGVVALWRYLKSRQKAALA